MTRERGGSGPASDLLTTSVRQNTVIRTSVPAIFLLLELTCLLLQRIRHGYASTRQTLSLRAESDLDRECPGAGFVGNVPCNLSRGGHRASCLLLRNFFGFRSISRGNCLLQATSWFPSVVAMAERRSAKPVAPQASSSPLQAPARAGCALTGPWKSERPSDDIASNPG